MSDLPSPEDYDNDVVQFDLTSCDVIYDGSCAKKSYILFISTVYKVCPESIQPCNMKNKDHFLKEDTRNIVYRTMMLQFP